MSVLFVQIAIGQSVSIDKAREMYFGMDESGKKALQLYQALEKSEIGTNFVLIAYKGASKAAAAGAVDGIRSKLAYFSDGKEMLEKAVAAKPLDAEIRFLRLATQLNAPSFLGYTGEIETDKKLVMNTMNLVAASHPNQYLYQQICNFLLLHGKLTVKEKDIVNKLLIKFK